MEDKFSPTDGGKVPKADAEKWIKKFEDERKDKLKDSKSIFFGKDFLQQIIDTPDIAGVSFFFAKKYSEHSGKDVLNLVLVPRKADGTLVWPTSTDGKDAPDDHGYDNGKVSSELLENRFMFLMDLAFWSSLVLILVPVFLLVVRFNDQPLYFKWLAFALVFSFSCDIASEILYLLRLPANLGGSTYSIFRPLFYSMLFYTYLGWRSLKLPFVIFNLLFLIFGFVNLLFIQKNHINSYTSTPGNFFILALTIFYFYKLLKDLPDEKIYETGLFWVVCGVFFNTSSRLILYSFTYYLIDVYNDNLVIYSFVNLGVNIIGTLIITYGTWLQYKKIKQEKSKSISS